MAFEYMVCDNLVRHSMCMFLDGRSHAKLLQAAPSATGDVDMLSEAALLAARHSFRVTVRTVTGFTLINIVVPKSVTKFMASRCSR